MIRPRELSASLGLFAARTPTLLPATHTNSYALGGRDVLLVEPATPYEDEQRAWIAWARELASTGRRIVAIVATHHHPDHVGGAALLSKELALPVWAHEMTASRVDVPVARRLADGDEIVLEGPRDETWRVLHTPGHAPGHVCLFEPRSRTVVVGDMVASVGTILVAPGDGDMTLYLEQLERLAALDASLALPAHGEPIDDPTALFHRYVAHRRMREAKILDALEAACAAAIGAGVTATELVPAAYDDVSPAIWPLAKLSVDAHLEKLEREGRIARTGEPDAFRVVPGGRGPGVVG
ncbi:MAG: MBL fold metallo-hydrolase [Labilithrix sp.]|nr:MBL fold metallo-hydrolase [Labilithrix sp.]